MSQIGRILTIAGVGVSAWIGGMVSERYKIKEMMHKPGLPIFATVSAATPIESSLTQPSKVNRVSEIMRFGFPSMDNIRSMDDFVLSYDKRNRVANWVFEHISKESTKKNPAVDRAKCEFYEDKSIHEFFRSSNLDYKGSGFDRGHMAAAGNHRITQQHCDQTFVLSNMAPQVGKGFNRDSWNRLEQHSRKLTQFYKNVYICTGPLYLPRKEADGKNYVKFQVIGKNNVAVPTHFFKVIVMEAENQKLDMEAYVMPNTVIGDGTPLNVFQVPPETVERAAGLLFFDKISRSKLNKINGRWA